MKNKSQWIIVSLIILCLFGCSDSWIPQQKPETPEERKAVMEHEIRILNNVPKTLAGHDQDWDDAIAMAHKVAVETHCKTRLYEYKNGLNPGFTGRVREEKAKEGE